LPIAVEQKISAALEKALKQPEVTTAMQTQGATPAFLGSAEMARFMAKDAKQWKQVADFAKIRLG
jgi:tripartite-type tricarboxylate transporter receptor subunit TctC